VAIWSSSGIHRTIYSPPLQQLPYYKGVSPWRHAVIVLVVTKHISVVNPNDNLLGKITQISENLPRNSAGLLGLCVQEYETVDSAIIIKYGTWHQD